MCRYLDKTAEYDLNGKLVLQQHNTLQWQYGCAMAGYVTYLPGFVCWQLGTQKHLPQCFASQGHCAFTNLPTRLLTAALQASSFVEKLECHTQAFTRTTTSETDTTICIVSYWRLHILEVSLLALVSFCLPVMCCLDSIIALALPYQPKQVGLICRSGEGRAIEQ